MHVPEEHKKINVHPMVRKDKEEDRQDGQFHLSLWEGEGENTPGIHFWSY